MSDEHFFSTKLYTHTIRTKKTKQKTIKNTMSSTFRLEQMLHKHLFNIIFISAYGLLEVKFKDIRIMVIDSQI